MAYPPSAASPAQPSHDTPEGGRDGAGACDGGELCACAVKTGPSEGAVPDDTIGFAGVPAHDTRGRLAALVGALRVAETYEPPTGDALAAVDDTDCGFAFHADSAEILAALTDLEDEDGSAPGATAFGPDVADATVLGFERAIVDFCTDLALGDRRLTGGYVTGGAVEGLLVGLRAARRSLPGAPLYVSAGAHHAARKQARRLGMEVVDVPRKDSKDSGAMDTEELRRLTAGRPGGAVVLACVESAAGGEDDLAAIRAAAAPAGPVHVHVEAGHTGLAAPFAPRPLAWDLRDGADSLSLTVHRLLDLPVPCGVALVACGGVGDAAATGPAGGGRMTRGHGAAPNPVAVALLWSALRARGYEGLRALALECYETAAYAVERLTAAGYRAAPTGHGLTVRFPRPVAAVCARWRLATEGPYATLTVFPPVTRARIDALCADLARGPALPTVPAPRTASVPRARQAS